MPIHDKYHMVRTYSGVRLSVFYPEKEQLVPTYGMRWINRRLKGEWFVSKVDQVGPNEYIAYLVDYFDQLPIHPKQVQHYKNLCSKPSFGKTFLL